MSLKALLEKQRLAQAAKAVSPTASESPKQEPAPVATDAPVAKPTGLKLALGKKPLTPAAPIPAPVESKIKGNISNLDALMADMATEDDVAATRIDTGVSGYADEIPCHAPERELPADLTEQQLGFVEQLNQLYGIMHDPELFGQIIRIIMQEMQENPDYRNLLADQDVHTMIRGLRSSMGLARIKKVEKTPKSRASKAPAAAAFSTTADEMFSSDDWD